MQRVEALRRHVAPTPAATAPAAGGGAKRAIVREFAKVPPPEGLAVIRVEEYTPKTAADLGPSDVLIRVRAASCNFPDLLQPSNQHNIKLELPFVSGSECAGTVEAVGARVARFRAGDKVMNWPTSARGAQGGMQSFVVAKEKWCYPIPAGLTFEEAAAVPLAYMTAYTALVHRGKLRAGESVLVLGATGGVGMAACHIAKAIGATVVGAGGSDAKLAVVSAEFGADHVVNYTTNPRFRDQVKAATRGKGVDLVYDPVSGSVLQEAFRSVRLNARVVIVGFAGAPVSGGVTGAPTQLILAKNLTVLGSGHDLFNPANIRAGMAFIRESIEAGKFRPRVHASYPLERARDAIRSLWDRSVIGKVVVVMPEL